MLCSSGARTVRPSFKRARLRRAAQGKLQGIAGKRASLCDEEELLASIAEISRGEFVSAEELLESLRQYG